MSYKTTEDFDTYTTSVNSQLSKNRPDGILFELYKSGMSVIDAVTILEEEFLTKCEILSLNEKCNFTLNSLVEMHDLDSLSGCISFTEDFFKRHKAITSKKISTLEEGVKFKIESLSKKSNELKDTKGNLSKIESISELKKYINEDY